ncbi:MAG: hypothetical protein OXF72_09835 [Gammaproteobacteria bacterium]|nr:hypothetical protein [Gammaproteobacteria bacterium]MCY4323717.1 hypothetical protein [Gammaproteobacteria bacterium]
MKTQTARRSSQSIDERCEQEKGGIVQHLDRLRRMCVAALILACLAWHAAYAQSSAEADLPTQHERVYENGDRYQGTMLDGMRHGQGRYEWAQGHVYEGGYENDLPNGEGVYTWPNGALYEGEFLQGVRHGRGRFTWGPGNFYEGEYQFGERTGVGRRVRHGETVYEGHYVAGVRHGEGRQVDDSGDQFSGWYEDGIRHGLGVRRKADGDRVLEQWVEGERQHTWRLVHNPRCALVAQSDVWLFLGEHCIDGMAHGRGIAARLDGALVQEQARAVLGRLLTGETRTLFVPGATAP